MAHLWLSLFIHFSGENINALNRSRKNLLLTLNHEGVKLSYELANIKLSYELANIITMRVQFIDLQLYQHPQGFSSYDRLVSVSAL